jgi:hypothetical protein
MNGRGWIGNIPDKFFKVTIQIIRKSFISGYTGFVKQKYHILYNAVENVPIYGAGNLIILCTALNCVYLSIGSSVVHSTLFIIGVMEYWSDGPKRIF